MLGCPALAEELRQFCGPQMSRLIRFLSYQSSASCSWENCFSLCCPPSPVALSYLFFLLHPLFSLGCTMVLQAALDQGMSPQCQQASLVLGSFIRQPGQHPISGGKKFVGEAKQPLTRPIFFLEKAFFSIDHAVDRHSNKNSDSSCIQWWIFLFFI